MRKDNYNGIEISSVSKPIKQVNMISKLITMLLELMFGLPIRGERLSKPTFTTVLPKQQLPIEQWVKDINFGRRWLTDTDWRTRHRRKMNERQSDIIQLERC